jgi:hypothetical protein
VTLPQNLLFKPATSWELILCFDLKCLFLDIKQDASNLKSVKWQQVLVNITEATK